MNLPQNILKIVEPVALFAKALINLDGVALKSMVPNWNTCGNAVIEIVKDYPEKLILPPEEAYLAISYTVGEEEQEYLPEGWKFPMIYIYQVEIDSWHIDLFLWTENGLGDLAVTLIIEDTPAGKRIIKLQDIRVQ
jgi:hypothetical protein